MNGQEKDIEIFAGAYSAEYWEYDSRLGRRWNTDPIYNPWESMYACFRNNPILCVDIKGNTADVVIVGGKDENKNDFLEVLNKGLGGFYTASIDKNNQLQLTKTDKKGEMNESQKAVFETFNEAIKNVMPINIEVTSHSPILYDSYDLGELDISDVKNTTDGPLKTQASLLTHFMTEQTSKQSTCIDDYDGDHDCAVYVDKKVAGGTTEKKFQRNSEFTTQPVTYKGYNDVMITGTIIVRGQSGDKPGIVLMKVVNGDVIKTKQIVLDKLNILSLEKIINDFKNEK